MTRDELLTIARLVRTSSRAMGDLVIVCRELPMDERERWITRCGKVLGAIYEQFIAPLHALDPELFPELKK